MSQKQIVKITTPVGRFVGGSIYEPRTTDYDGKPLVVKSGPNAGKARVDFNFGVAIPKTPGVTHWASEPWGAGIWALAHQSFPNGETQRPDFAWKIVDGDSQVPNKKMKKPCDQEGYPGHWVVWFSGGTKPRVYNADGTQLILEDNAIKPGYYVQVFGNVTDNKPSQSPGLYINHSMLAFSGVGPEISFGPDVSEAGFGKGVALPPGATAYTGQPVPPAPGVPATGAANVPPPPAPPGAVAAPPAAPAAPARQMTAAANGATYEAMIAAGWTDATLIANGMMIAPAPNPATVGSAPPPAPPAATVVAPPPSNVTPNPDMRAVPAGTATPPPPPGAVTPPPAVGRQMTAKAAGQTYEALIAAGWNDTLLLQHGMMTQ